jgi:hypothetical protein
VPITEHLARPRCGGAVGGGRLRLPTVDGRPRIRPAVHSGFTGLIKDFVAVRAPFPATKSLINFEGSC